MLVGIQRGLVGPALRGRSEREKILNWLKNSGGNPAIPPLSTNRRLSVGTAWWSAVQRRLVVT